MSECSSYHGRHYHGGCHDYSRCYSRVDSCNCRDHYHTGDYYGRCETHRTYYEPYGRYDYHRKKNNADCCVAF